MVITYIYHSCFTVEEDEAVFIFDYYKGALPVFDTNKTIYVFGSHKHRDHFNDNIFHQVENYPSVFFILSKDIKTQARENIIYVGPNETIEVGDTRIETLKSTDLGVAFIVTYQGKTLYHAGDLNWWSWPGESEEEYEEMTKRFVVEMRKVVDRHFDVAFLPLDARQEERFWWGMDYFLRITQTDHAFPMHFWEDYSVISRIMQQERSLSYRENMMDITHKGQSFLV